MFTFVQKPKATQQTTPAKSTIPAQAHFGRSRMSVYSRGPSRIQTKLKINTLGDAYEQEADHVSAVRF
jgi:hypothetical protein